MSDNQIKRIQSEVFIKTSTKLQNIIIKALKPESETPSSNRSNTIIKKIDGGILIISTASDITALRASLNSYLRWIQGIVNMVEKIK
jgi:tRNA threonylcarbamoyladenosine modification (KEOPS) complex  Pcc1 subunit